MKLILLTYILLNSALVISQVAEFDFLDKTTVKWDKTPEGELLEHYFVFKNTGDIPLKIHEAKVTCPCTKVSFPEKPTLPNQKDSILVTFDTNEKFYWQNRTVEILANTTKNEKLKLKVYVIPKDEMD